MRSLSIALVVGFCSSSFAGECCEKAQYSTAYVEETVVVKRPVLLKRTPVFETREKQVTVKENVLVGYKEEVVESAPRKRPFAGLFQKRRCNSCN